jgi:2-hydroxy-6-oxonona-2,4-dienedioate hydrolase
MSSTVFVSDEKKELIRGWYDRFRVKVLVPTEEMRVDTSFGRTHIFVAGPKDAPPLLMLHGALASSAHMMSEMGPLLKRRRVYAIDIIGQSVKSEDRRLELKDDSCGRWVDEVATALGLDTYDIFGISWGGFIARRAAEFAPERIGHLVMLNPAGWVANTMWRGFRDTGIAMLRYRFAPSENNLLRVMNSLFSNVDPDWMAYFGDALQAYKLDMRIPPHARPDDVAGIKAAVLVIASDLDASFPGATLIERVRALIPHAEVELLKNTKHCPPISDEFRNWMAARIERFLEEDAMVEK